MEKILIDIEYQEELATDLKDLLHTLEAAPRVDKHNMDIDDLIDLINIVSTTCRELKRIIVSYVKED